MCTDTQWDVRYWILKNRNKCTDAQWDSWYWIKKNRKYILINNEMHDIEFKKLETVYWYKMRCMVLNLKKKWICILIQNEMHDIEFKKWKMYTDTQWDAWYWI